MKYLVKEKGNREFRRLLCQITLFDLPPKDEQTLEVYTYKKFSFHSWVVLFKEKSIVTITLVTEVSLFSTFWEF